MRLSATQRKTLYLIVLPLTVAYSALVASGALFGIPVLNGLAVAELEQADAMRPPAKPNPEIVEIIYDDETASRLGENPDIKGVPRKYQAELISLLDKAGAKVALFDVMFVNKNPADPLLRKSLASLHSLKVTLATSYDEDSHEGMQPMKGVATGPLHPVSVCNDVTSSNVRIGSIFGEQTEATSKYIGGFPLQRDSRTNRLVVYAPVSAVLQAIDVPISQLHLDLERLKLTAGSLAWSLDRNGAIEARWTKSPMPFPKWDYVKALVMLRSLRNPGAPNPFRGKIVVIGKHDAADRADTIPYGTIDGVDFIAHMTNTALLSFDQQEDMPPLLLDLFAVALGAFGFLSVFTRRIVLAGVGLASLTALCVELQRWLAARDSVFPISVSLGAMFLASLAGLILGRYWIDRVDLSPPQESEEATVLFLDIKGSTVLLNSIGRARYQALIDRLFASYGKTVAKSGGQIERTLGDGFLAIFRGASPRHHALRCADCCRELVDNTQDIANKIGIPVEVALGFESGIVGGGYVIEGNKKVWSSQGSTIHLAQRIQSQCGPLGETILMGPVARRLMEGQRGSEVVTHAVVKGFDEQVEISKLTR